MTRILDALRKAERAFFRPPHDEDPPPRALLVGLGLAVVALAVLLFFAGKCST